MAKRFTVPLGKRGYDVLIGGRLLAEAGNHIAPFAPHGRIIVVSDENVARLYLHRLTGALDEAGLKHRSVIVKPGEASKSIGAFSALLEQILEQAPDRRTLLVALGGGVVGDVTGFAASVLLRGLDFIQIPTSLLAQVDSSVGGKTGINSAFGKNLIGSFHQPRLVLADTSVLASLPKRQLLSGYAETLKYGLIGDENFFSWLEKKAAALLAGDADALTHAIFTACQAKASIVAQDERESGRRALLNFGHTFGHALEAEAGFSGALLHGEAVAVGMLLALKASVAMGLCPEDHLERVAAHYRAVGLPMLPPRRDKPWRAEALMDSFLRDKKAEGGAPVFILSRGIGRAFVSNGADLAVIRQTLAELCTNV